jgi:alkaline phosphatase D
MTDVEHTVEVANEPSAGPLFLHGVASGDPRSDRVMIWTRVSSQGDESIAVRWQIATERGFRHPVAGDEVRTSASVDFTVKVDVVGLKPDTKYFYRFEVLGQCSPVGRTKTLPDTGIGHVRFALACCAKLNAGFFNAYARIADRSDDLDFVLHLGDYIYESAEEPLANAMHRLGQIRSYDPPTECMDLDGYRRRYARYRLDPDLQRLHQALPMIATIDDHEVADGAWLKGSGTHDPGKDGTWVDRRRYALQARWEWLPLRMPNPDDPEQIFQSVRIGELLDLFLIDTRNYRDRPLDGQGVSNPERTALGRRQREWLLRELDSSNAIWRLIGSPALMAAISSDSLPLPTKKALRTLKLIDPQNDGPDSDPWAGYTQERDSLLRHLRDSGIGNVVVLSGDVHVALASELLCERSSDIEAPVAVEFVTASITSQNLDDKMGWAPRTESRPIEQSLKHTLPHLRWCDLDSHGYVVVDVKRERVLAEWWFVGAIHEHSPEESCGAAWKVESDQPRLIEVPRPSVP